MEVVKGIEALSRPLVHPVVTIGNFDGVHLGHQCIIRTAIDQARARKGTAVAYTFRPHPQVILRPGSQVQLLTSYDEKLELVKELGIDLLVEEPFSRDFSTIAPEQFFTDILLHRLNAEAIVVGYDFAFGKNRQGHLDALQSACSQAKVDLTVVPPYKLNQEIVSSSRIRQYLLQGNIPAANRLLGREFFYRGVVIRGEGRGRKIGFPTANLKFGEKLNVPNGVYVTSAIVNGKNRFPSVTNVGVRPTFDSGLAALVETYLIDQEIDLYGTTLEVCFIERLRDEKKFSGINELKAQIALDVEAARERFPRS